MSKGKKIACVATFPDRIDIFKKTVESIIDQVDELNIYLNGYGKIPSFLKSKKINAILSKAATGDLKDNGKFYFLDKCSDDDYYFTIDDDIFYPKNYIQKMVEELDKFDGRVVIGVHGIIFLSEFMSFRETRDTLHFTDFLKSNRVVSALGTGTLAFRRGLLGDLRLDDFLTTGMADLYFAEFAKKNNIPLISISRKREWLKSLFSDGSGEFSLWDDSFDNESRQNKIIIKNQLWDISHQAVEFYKFLSSKMSTSKANDKTVSIVIPTLGSRDLSVVFDSLAEQTYCNYQIELIFDRDRLGACFSRNAGAEISKGGYVLFLDDDIFLEKDCLKIMTSTLDKNPKDSFCYCDYKMTGSYNTEHKAKKFDPKSLRINNYISTMSMIRKDDVILWDKNLKRLQDWDYWLTLSEGGKTGVYIPEALFTAYYGKDAISSNYNDSYEFAKMIVQIKHGIVSDAVKSLSDFYTIINNKNELIQCLEEEISFNDNINKEKDIEIDRLKFENKKIENNLNSIHSSSVWKIRNKIAKLIGRGEL